MPIFLFRVTTALLMLGAPLTHHAQSRTPVAVLPVTTTVQRHNDAYAARALEGLLTASLGKLGRISVLDRSQTDLVTTERETQKSVDFIDSRTLAAQGQSLGALYVLTANVDKVALTETRLDSGKDHQGTMTVSIRLIDVATQEVRSSAVINSDAGSGGKKGLGGMLRSVLTVHDTPDDALTAMVANLRPGLEEFFKTAFPVRFTIAQVERLSADSTHGTFLIDGGKNVGARPRMVLAVLEQSDVKIGARVVRREREIGTLEIVSLDGEELSIGTMKTGARDVATLVAAGKTVIAVPR